LIIITPLFHTLRHYAIIIDIFITLYAFAISLLPLLILRFHYFIDDNSQPLLITPLIILIFHYAITLLLILLLPLITYIDHYWCHWFSLLLFHYYYWYYIIIDIDYLFSLRDITILTAPHWLLLMAKILLIAIDADYASHYYWYWYWLITITLFIIATLILSCAITHYIDDITAIDINYARCHYYISYIDTAIDIFAILLQILTHYYCIRYYYAITPHWYISLLLYYYYCHITLITLTLAIIDSLH